MAFPTPRPRRSSTASTSPARRRWSAAENVAPDRAGEGSDGGAPASAATAAATPASRSFTMPTRSVSGKCSTIMTAAVSRVAQPRPCATRSPPIKAELQRRRIQNYPPGTEERRAELEDRDADGRKPPRLLGIVCSGVRAVVADGPRLCPVLCRRLQIFQRAAGRLRWRSVSKIRQSARLSLRGNCALRQGSAQESAVRQRLQHNRAQWRRRFARLGAGAAAPTAGPEENRQAIPSAPGADRSTLLLDDGLARRPHRRRQEFRWSQRTMDGKPPSAQQRALAEADLARLSHDIDGENGGDGLQEGIGDLPARRSQGPDLGDGFVHEQGGARSDDRQARLARRCPQAAAGLEIPHRNAR